LAESDWIACIGCGASFEQRDGPTHRYMESSPGCWAAFGQVLALEYSEASYARAHRLSVDAYAVQHPGRPSPQSVQSVALHLISLCLILEQGLDFGEATDAIRAAADAKGRFCWLPPPPLRGERTVADVLGSVDGDDHQKRVRSWAASAWAAWASHHATVRSWLSPREEHMRT
jgi:hypothetical protein